MDIKTKCDIIEEFMRDYTLHDESDEGYVDEFIQFNDLGIPLAQSVSYDLATLTSNGEFLVNETWLAFCLLFNVDPEGDYQNLDEFFESD